MLVRFKSLCPTLPPFQGCTPALWWTQLQLCLNVQCPGHEYINPGLSCTSRQKDDKLFHVGRSPTFLSSPIWTCAAPTEPGWYRIPTNRCRPLQHPQVSLLLLHPPHISPPPLLPPRKAACGCSHTFFNSFPGIQGSFEGVARVHLQAAVSPYWLTTGHLSPPPHFMLFTWP